LEGQDVDKKEPLWKPGHAYEGKDLASEFDIKKGVDLFKRPESSGQSSEDEEEVVVAGDDDEEEDGDDGRGDTLSGKEKKRLKKEEKKRKKEEKKEKKKRKRKREEEGDNRDGDMEKEADDGRGPATSTDKSFWGADLAEAPAAPVAADAVSDVPSWRGRLDPTRKAPTGGRGGMPGRGGRGGSMFGKAFRGGRTDTSGIGGMNRRR